MAFQQNGYTLVPQAVTYDEWRHYALTHGVNVDFAWGNQCWDICALLWYQYGLRLETGPLGYAKECWLVSRNVNARPPFIQIPDLANVKRGDVLVFTGYGTYRTGHIGFADQDYNGSGRIDVLGQNQGQGIGYGTPSNVVSMGTVNFLGAFRNTKWETAPSPEPEPATKGRDNKFNWVLYGRKLRNRRRFNNVI